MRADVDKFINDIGASGPDRRAEAESQTRCPNTEVVVLGEAMRRRTSVRPLRDFASAPSALQSPKPQERSPR